MRSQSNIASILRVLVLAILGIFLGTTTLLQAQEKKPRQILKGHTDAVYCVSFSPDGKTLASGSADGTIRLWDPATGKCQKILKSPKRDRIETLVYRPDGKMIASGLFGMRIDLWDLAADTGTRLSDDLRMAHEHHLAFSSDGKFLASGSGLSSLINLWDVTTRKPVAEIFDEDSGVNAFRFADNKKLLVLTAADGLKAWDAPTAKKMTAPKLPEKEFDTAVFAADCKTIAAISSEQKVIKIWSVETGKEKLAIRVQDQKVLTRLCLSADGRLLASGDTEWDKDTSAFGAPLQPRVWQIKVWNVATGKQLVVFEVKDEFLRCLAFSPNGRMLASTGNAKTIELWDVLSPDGH